jgi:hypothetical protein
MISFESFIHLGEKHNVCISLSLNQELNGQIILLNKVSDLVIFNVKRLQLGI